MDQMQVNYIDHCTACRKRCEAKMHVMPGGIKKRLSTCCKQAPMAVRET